MSRRLHLAGLEIVLKTFLIFYAGSMSVLGDLRTLKRGIDAYLGEPLPQHSGGNFLLFAACLMALEYFSRIYVSNGTAHLRVRKYSADFLVPINPRYQDATGIMWRAARNGMLHASWPSRFCTDNDSTEYMFKVGNEISDAHLTFVNGVLNISGPRLLQDLEQSVDTGLAPWINASGDSVLLARGQPCVIEIKDSDALHMQEIEAMLAWGDG